MSLQALTHRVLMTAAQFPQPAGKTNMERFGGKKVCVCVIPAETGDNLWIDNLDAVVKERRKQLIDYLSSYDSRSCEREHEQIARFVEHHAKNLSNVELHAKEKLKAHEYVLQSLRRYRGSRDQTRENLRQILTEELETSIKDIRKSFLGEIAANDDPEF